uniref:Reverse transcriptase domain-containing protein n=1 Tax=Arion vulgaris TaxID=1028688 RepID=A0A0B6XXW5_9EUPU
MTKTTEILPKDFIFNDDASLVAHSEATLQSLINNMARACDLFSLIISINKMVVFVSGK